MDQLCRNKLGEYDKGRSGVGAHFAIVKLVIAMAIQRTDKYADYLYKIQSETELEEAKWLIAQGDFKDLDDYINYLTRAEIRWMKEQEKSLITYNL